MRFLSRHSNVTAIAVPVQFGILSCQKHSPRLNRATLLHLNHLRRRILGDHALIFAFSSLARNVVIAKGNLYSSSTAKLNDIERQTRGSHPPDAKSQ